MSSQRHISEFGELEGVFWKNNILQGCKSNQKFYRSENQK